MKKYVIILNGTNFPYYLCFDPDRPRPTDWTHFTARAEKFDTYKTAQNCIEEWGIEDARIEEINLTKQI